MRTLQEKRPYKGGKKLPKWQLLTILITMILMLISALPNFYSQQSSIEIVPQKNSIANVSMERLNSLLSNHAIDVASIHNTDGLTQIVLASNQQLTAAKKILKNTLADRYTVQSKQTSKAPQWLKSLGLQPIKLGLDLSGGVLFILEVDSESAYSEKMDLVRQSLQSLFRKAELRGIEWKINSKKIIHIRFSEPTQVPIFFETISEQLKKQFPELLLSRKDTNNLSLSFSEKYQLEFHQQVMQQTLTTMRSRIDDLGITEAVTQRQGHHRIRIELPGIKNSKDAEKTIGATASLDFYQIQKAGGKRFKTEQGEIVSVNPKVIFSGDNISDARAGRDNVGVPLVNLKLDSIGGKKMLRFSSKNIGKPMVTVFKQYEKNDRGKTVSKSRVINIATIQSTLGKQFSITNLKTIEAARELALLIRAGSLSAPVTIVKRQTIGASLGQSNIDNGLAALMLGVGLTLAFMALWYRRLGLVANIALLFNLVCLLGLMSLLPGAVLTLPGIAGLVLTVGMAVDTNVIIFERIKQEKKCGRNIATAIERGYKNALATILDANITTLIVATILYGIGFGPVKGFAVTLGLGIITSLFTGVFVSRALTLLFHQATKSPFTKTIATNLGGNNR